MKKKILLIITFMMIIFIPSVRAEGNMKVIFNTSFEEQIDINKIEKIFVMMDDEEQKDYEIVLEYKDNFRFELNNLPQGDIIINSITVSRDYTVNYDYQYAITRTSEEETNVSILVTKVTKDENRKKVQVSNEYIAEILGYDPLKVMNPTTTTESIDNKTTSSPSNSDDGPVVIGSMPTTTTITKSETEIKEEEQKQEQEKRKSIYLMILLIFMAAIIIIGVVIGIKIANANK